MDFYTINIKKYKALFFQAQIFNAVIVIASYFLIKKGIYMLAGFDPGKKLTLPVLFIMLVLAATHTYYQRKKLKRLADISDFDERVTEYEKFYRLRMLWIAFSCLVSCVLSVLTGRYLFLYYALFDILIALPYYPSLSLLKRELKNDEIILY